MLSQKTDGELLQQMAIDSTMAFEEVHKRYAAKLLIYAMNVLKNKEVCEDKIQNIFIDLWTKRKSNTIKSLSSYLFTAVKYQIFNHLRDNKLSSRDLTRLNIIDVSMNASEEVEYTELEKIISNYVTQLPRRCQEIFVLSRYQHKSHKEIAGELDISIQAVKNQISKALGFIRKNLQQEELIYTMAFLYLL